MAGNSQSPGAVHSALISNTYLLGPLSRIMDAAPATTMSNAPIKAIWRNELGTAAISTVPTVGRSST